MGFSCNDKDKLTPIIIDNLDRDLGLSNIYNVNSDVTFCLEKFNSPLFYMSGATKPYENIFSGCTDVSGDGSYLIDVGTVYGCPSGYLPTIDNDDCIQINVTGATSAGTFYTVGPASTNGAYGGAGTRFYEEITNKTLPIQNQNNTTYGLVDATNDPNPYPGDILNPSGVTLNIEYNITTGTFWYNAGGDTDRLNQVGIWANPDTVTDGDYIGFSQCVDIPTSGLYHIGIAADNYCKVKLNGDTIVVLERNSSYYDEHFTVWHIFPMTLTSGKNIIEMEGAEHAGSDTAFGAEIYSADIAILTGATTVGELGIIFTTSGLTGNLFQTGDNSGWNCPSGYALDTCVTGTPFCSEILRVTGLTTTTGVTVSCDPIINTSLTDTFDINFNITGGTDYTGYTGQFCYEIYNSDVNIGAVTTTPTYSDCLDYSGLTSTTITVTLTSGVDIPISDNDYRIRTYNTFEPKDCDVDSVNTKDTSSLGFDFNNEWYFTTLTNPPTPLFTEIVGIIQGGSLRTDNVQIVDGQTEYNLETTPNGGKVIVNVNGITLTETLDYTINYSFLPGGLVMVSFTESLETTDILTFTYITPGDPTQIIQTDTDLFSIETLVLTGLTTGTTASTINIVNDNISDGIKEFFTQYDFLNSSNILLTINGIELTQGSDYFLSSKTENKINFHPNVGEGLSFGTVISVFYFKKQVVLQEGNLGKLSSNDVNVQWYITEALPTDSSGYFDIEITEEGDTTYSATTNTSTTEYIEDQLSYGLLFEDVEVNKKYIYRVCMSKTQSIITKDNLITTVCSENGSFNLTSGTAIYNNI